MCDQSPIRIVSKSAIIGATFVVFGIIGPRDAIMLSAAIAASLYIDKMLSPKLEAETAAE